MRRLCLVLSLLCLLPVANAAAQDAEETSTVEIVEAGAAPQRALRHRFAAGVTQPIQLRVQSQMRMTLGERDNTVPMPILRLDVTFGPTEIADNGNVRYAFLVTDVGISGGTDPQVDERVQGQIAGLVGAHGQTEMNDRGEVVSFEYELAEGAAPELRQQAGILRDSMTRLLPRFPEEPVGTGAVWRVSDQLNLPNMRVAVATTYRLVSWQGDRIELAVSTETIDENGQPANAARIEVSGTGRLRFELGTLQTRGRIQTVAAAHIRGPGGEMRMRIRTRMQITPR